MMAIHHIKAEHASPHTPTPFTALGKGAVVTLVEQPTGLFTVPMRTVTIPQTGTASGEALVDRLWREVMEVR